MVNNLNGKKLLILGAYSSEIEIIEEAKKHGIYTIVTDNHMDWSLAPAKYKADEAWNISWSDIESLYKKCVEEKIDGCMAGFSERRVAYAQKLCHMLDLPFYTDGAKLDIIFDKSKFKAACKKCGIRVPKEYSTADDEIVFPVIVKPSDNGGSRGISICYDAKELIEATRAAKLYSDKNEVLIEEYIKSDEVMVYFLVHNGIVDFSAMCDRMMHKFSDKITQLPVGYYFLSKYLSVFKEHNLHKFVNLIKSLEIKNGLIAFQSFVVGNDVIPFDPTYRLDGTISYHLLSLSRETNHLEMLINYSLTGSMGNDEIISKWEKPELEKENFEMTILLGKGTISKIVGINQIKSLKNVVYVYQNLFEGDQLSKEADFSQIAFRIHIRANNKKELKSTVEQINEILKVYDSNNANMIIYRMDPNYL